MKQLGAVFLILCLGLPGSALGADLDAGMLKANNRDYAGAFREWRPLAEAGDARAQYFLGTLYESGLGVPRDHERAAHWFRQAAIQGEVQAQNSLAILYAEGWGVPRSLPQAYFWFTLAADSGNGFALRNRERLIDTLSDADFDAGQRLVREHRAGKQ